MLPFRNLIKINAKLQVFQLKNIRYTSTIADQLTKWTEKLSSEQISEPKSSVINLLSHVLQTRNLEEIEKNPTKELNECEIKELEALCLARLCHMPVQYIIKEWDFRELQGVKMVPPVFIPRPETEQLVSHTINDLKRDSKAEFNFLEVGCGSGVISISLLQEFPHAKGFCFDQNLLAVELTKSNADNFKVLDRLKVVHYKLTEGNLPSEMENMKFDMIISNPPYVPSRELVGLADEIKVFEDLRALDGGRDGLVVINNILGLAERFLKGEGRVWLEVHQKHSKMLKERSFASGLVLERSYKDFCDKDRFIKFIKKGC